MCGCRKGGKIAALKSKNTEPKPKKRVVRIINGKEYVFYV